MTAGPNRFTLLLAEAQGLLQGGRLREADEICSSLAAQAPASGDVIHLLGLVRKRQGSHAEAERLLRKSVELAPARAEFHANLGNLLASLERHAEAEQVYRCAIVANAAFRPAHLGLLRALLATGRAAEAAERARAMLDVNRNDAEAWAELGVALRAMNQPGEAEQAYRHALELRPDYGVARHNLGALLAQLGRAEEALCELDRAAATGVRAHALRHNRARALIELQRFAEAEHELAAAVTEQPRNAESQTMLANLRFVTGDADFARDLCRAARQNPGDLRLQLGAATVLRQSGSFDTAENLLRATLGRAGAEPALLASLATVLQEAGRPADALQPARAAAEARPDDLALGTLFASILLSVGHAGEALPWIRRARERAPLDQSHIALEATAARVLGDPLYESLYDYDRLVRTYELSPPAPWSTLQAFHAELRQALEQRHQLQSHPLDQSLRSGTQTSRSLLADSAPCIQAFLRAIEEPIADYCRAAGFDARHPLRARNTGQAQLVGCWSVRLRRGGFHVNHVHPDGWLSSAYYVQVPAEVEDAALKSGWIKFGEPRYPVPGCSAARFVQPRPGRLVLFPSYLWHGTTPIAGDEPRLTIAFDARPRGKTS
jgi:tetratricopeptide (TPR) repeat protein